jgi:uncharacterized membrane-anchored protein
MKKFPAHTLNKILIALVITISLSPVYANETTLSIQEKEIEEAFEAAVPELKAGPTKIDLQDQGILELPEGFGFIPHHEAMQIHKALGNNPSSSLLGLIIDKDLKWLIDVDYLDVGYIKDDEASTISSSANNLLETIRKITEKDNINRRAMGISPLNVKSWLQKPSYDKNKNILFWSILGHDDEGGQFVNYKVNLLGREGIISLVLIADGSAILQEQETISNLFHSIQFNPEKRYSDFNSATDKIAGYGLIALITGVVAKKLGLFALAGAFIAKFAKVIGVILFAGAGVIINYFRNFISKIFNRNK